MICMRNASESINARYGRARGHFPIEQVAL